MPPYFGGQFSPQARQAGGLTSFKPERFNDTPVALAITAVYVTHDQAEAMALGDRVAVMEHGRIAQIGTPQEIYYRPATAFVANFIGAMNRIDGVMFRPEDVRILDGGGDWQGTVQAAFFLGDHTRLLVDVGQADPIAVRTHERRIFRAGDPIALAVEQSARMALRGG